MFKPENHGFQLLLNLQDHSQFALEPTVLMELTALEPYALEPTGQWTVHQVLHALEKSQLLSHTITPSQPPDNHIKLPETLPQLTHPLLTHQPQSLLPLSKLIQHQKLEPTKKPTLLLEPVSTTRDTHNQKRSSSLTQRLPELTLPSILNNEDSDLNK